MIKPIVCNWLVTGGIIMTCMAAEPIQPVKGIILADGEALYPVIDGEAVVNDQLIRRIAIGSKKVTVSYRNKTDKGVQPAYTVRFYNPHGLLVGEEEVKKGIIGVVYVSAGEVATDDLRVDWMPLDRIFAKSSAALPDDWSEVKWVVISNTNTRIE